MWKELGKEGQRRKERWDQLSGVCSTVRHACPSQLSCAYHNNHTLPPKVSFSPFTVWLTRESVAWGSCWHGYSSGRQPQGSFPQQKLKDAINQQGGDKVHYEHLGNH